MQSTVSTFNRSERPDLNERADKVIQDLVKCESELRRVMATSNKYKVPEIYAGFTSLSNAIEAFYLSLKALLVRCTENRYMETHGNDTVPA